MKKLVVLLASLTIALAACTSEKNETQEPIKKDETTTEGKVNPAAEMMNFYLSISKSINEVDKDLNNFENAQGEEILPEGAELQSMKDSAKLAAENVSTQLASLEVPEALVDQQGAIEGALLKLQEAYTMKAEALASEGEVVLEEANATFQEADEELNEVLKEVGLVGSSIFNEVSL